MKAYVVVFLSVLVAELGAKTQLATLLFAANPTVSKLGVFAAAAGALVASSALAVAVGTFIGGWVPPDRLRILAALGFIGIGLWMLLARS
jgi:putative Ca2+/H+ antiporter (TMEM165/GDT1 family)